MHEYRDMAKYYDIFYSDKSYEKEVKFLTNLVGNRRTILDVGCGTGIHMHLLEEKGYQVDGLDLNTGMLEIAKTRVSGNLFEENLLDFKINKKYDAVISMFAVFNHLDNYEDFEKGILHCYQHLNPDGILIIDLHNGRSDGEKVDTKQGYQRIMKWQFDSKNFKEYTDISYTVDGEIYSDQHIFLIYEIEKIKQVLDKHNLNYQIYENYSFHAASDSSKNIEIVITNGK